MIGDEPRWLVLSPLFWLQARRASRLAEMLAVDLQATEANKNAGAVEEERQSASKASSGCITITTDEGHVSG